MNFYNSSRVYGSAYLIATNLTCHNFYPADPDIE